MFWRKLVPVPQCRISCTGINIVEYKEIRCICHTLSITSIDLAVVCGYTPFP